MKRLFTLIFVSFLFTQVQAQCDYELVMVDSWGDGWDGASIDIDVNGTVTNYTLAAGGGPQTNIVTVNDGDAITFTYNASGCCNGEHGYEFRNSVGSVVFSDGPALSTAGTSSAPGPSPSTTPMTHTASCPTCTPPAGTGVAVDACGTSQFNVDVDVTALGDGTPSITDGTTTWLVSSTGSNIVGPFPEGTSVNLTLQHGADAGCDVALGSFTFACPPPNDALCNATPLTLGAACTGDIYTNVGASTEVGEPSGSCFTGGAQKTVWFSVVGPTSGSLNVTLDIAPGDINDSEIALYGEGAGFDCADLTTLDAELECDQDGSSGITTSVGNGWLSAFAVTGLTAGETYYIQVSGYNNSEGAFCIEASEPCAITAIVDGGTSTACNPVTNEYAQDVTITYNSAPATGTLDVTIDGITVNATITGSPQTVTVAGLTADGAAKDVTAVFSDDTGCTLSETGVFTAPSPCTVTCDILSIADAGTGVMNCVGATYDYEVVVTYANAPVAGTLDVTAGGITVNAAIGTSPQTVTITGLATGAGAIDVTAVFSADPTCTLTETGVFTAPTGCPPVNDNLCNATALTVGAACTGDLYTNVLATTETNEPSPGCYVGGAQKTVWFSFVAPASGNANITLDIAPGALNDSEIALFDGAGVDCADLSTLAAEIDCDQDGTSGITTSVGNGWLSAIAATGLTGGGTYYVQVSGYNNGEGTFCIEVSEPCSISGITDGGTSTACDPGTNQYAQDVVVSFVSAPATGTLDVTIDGITVNAAIGTSPQTVTVPGLTADGVAKDVTATFSDDTGCTLTANGVFTAPAPCTATCSIVSITDAGTGVMNCAGSTYEYDVIVAFSTPPASGTLDVNGQSFAIGTSPQTVTLTGLATGAGAVDVTAVFSADAGCTATEVGLFTAPTSCPLADDCASAIDVTANINGGAIAVGNNTSATGGTMTPPATGFNTFTGWGNTGNDNDVWMKVDVSGLTGCFGFMSVSTLGSSFDTQLSIWDGCSGTLLGANDDFHGAGNGFTSLTTACVTNGNTYYIQVDGYNGDDGEVTLDIVLVDITGAVPHNAGAVTADFECTGSDGWTHYVNTTNAQVLLSVEKNGENLGAGVGTPTGGSCVNQAGSVAPNLGLNGCGAPYTNQPDWFVMNRTWDLSPGSQPANPVNIRSYYTAGDLADVNANIAVTHTTLTHYKLTGDEDLSTNPCHAGTTGYIEFDGGEYTTGTCGADFYASYPVSGFSGGGGGGGTGNRGALPIELIAFSGQAMDGYNQLKWTSAAEQNTRMHYIERSANGIDGFREVGSVAAAGNSEEELNYSLNDNSPLILSYYRLKTLDFDGSVQYSNVISIQREGNVFDVVNTYPVPTTKDITVEFVTAEDEEVVYTLTDITGKVVMQNSIDATKGLNKQVIDMTAMSNGVYFLSLQNSTSRVIKNIVKN